MPLCSLCRAITPRSIVPSLPPGYYPLSGQAIQSYEGARGPDAKERSRVLYRHHDNIRLLRSSAQQCELCRLLLKVLTTDSYDTPRETFPWSYTRGIEIEGIPSLKMEADPDDQIWGRPPGEPAELTQLMVRWDDKARRLLNVSATEGSLAAVSGNVAGREPSSQFDTGPYFQTPRRWLQECVRDHDECRLPAQSCDDPSQIAAGDGVVKLPTRVLDASYLKPIRLVETIDLETQYGRYAALSHCWGPSPSLKTTTKLLTQHKEGIPRNTLPKTFLEAISVARWLGIRYLWIDALCIVQDDPEDWRRESVEMGRIYHYAHVTISAASAKDHSEGLFLSHPEPTIPPVEMPYFSQDCEPAGSFFISQRIGSFPTLERTGALNSRAWTLQEKLLSRRILHFAHDQMYWECLHHKQAEDNSPFDDESEFDTGLRKSRFLYGNQDLRFSDSAKPVTVDPDEVPIYPIYWNRMVENYTRRNLTYTSDKLPALQGIANVLKYTIGSEYYAGLWKFSLDLMWRRPRGSKLSQPLTIRAPSWSWASLDGPIDYNGLEPYAYGDSLPSCKDVEDVSVRVNEVAVQDENGKNMVITTGTVSLKARCNFAVRMNHLIKESFDPWKNFDYKARSRLMPDASSIAGNKFAGSYHRNGLGYHPLVSLGQTREVVGWGAFDDESWPTSQPVTCLLIDRLGSAYKPRNYYVLLVVNVGHGVCRRVGMGQVTKANFFDKSQWQAFTII